MIFHNTPIFHIVFCPYCLVPLSIINDRPFIALDKWRQKYAHCIVLCSLCTSSLYNVVYLNFFLCCKILVYLLQCRQQLTSWNKLKTDQLKDIFLIPKNMFKDILYKNIKYLLQYKYMRY